MRTVKEYILNPEYECHRQTVLKVLLAEFSHVTKDEWEHVLYANPSVKEMLSNTVGDPLFAAESANEMRIDSMRNYEKELETL